jgi:hypothetical protein
VHRKSVYLSKWALNRASQGLKPVATP